MSHSKYHKRGRSLYLENWNPAAKKYINTCKVCGAQGYDPSIEDEGFVHPSPNCTDTRHRAMLEELTRAYRPLPLDDMGRCECCARVMDGD